MHVQLGVAFCSCLLRCAASSEPGALGVAVPVLTGSSLEEDFFAGSSITCGAPSWVAPRQFPPQPALCCCQCSGLFEGQLQGKLWAGSGRRGLSPRPCFPVMVTSPSNQLTAFRHFLPLLSCGFWCVFVPVLPFGERDGGRGRSPQCLKGSG